MKRVYFSFITANFPLFISSLSTASSVSAFSATSSSRRPLVLLNASPAESTSSTAAAGSREATGSTIDGAWAIQALLFSSLSDGVIPNTAARSFLRHSLVNALLREQVNQNENGLKSSAEFSPCNGPNVDVLENLETVDQIVLRGQQFSSDDFDTSEKVDSWAAEALQYLSSDTNDELNLRVLYIPTASYALNPQSSNTPGKQRQRARADGKKRRTQLLNLLGELLSSDYTDGSNDGLQFKLLSTTLDLDDGSLKQPVGSDDTSLFPANDKAALSTWSPHLIYLEGGNTFWLQHCIDKGGYSTLIKDACTGPSGAVYCGKSAGAIVAGRNVATATWKGWDDPSVVEGKESYDDWLDCRGFEFVGNQSFFPHMSDDWKDMVADKLDEQNLGKNVDCLREEDVCCVMGDKTMSFVATGPSP